VSEISISQLLAVMPDAEALDEHWRRICREMVGATAAAERERGLHEGYLLAVADFKAYLHGVVRDAEVERRRWHLCCRQCRLEGHRDDCPDCEDRTREAFGVPRPGDYPSGTEGIARARAAWEKAGFSFPHWGPGWVHLGGPPVHWHKRCTRACYACEPGWHRIEDAIAIIGTLPGDYTEVLAELRAQAGVSPGRTAA
jgi:hypothetical protein